MSKALPLLEKAAAGWFGGCNSSTSPWLMPDNKYRWGVNIVCRGGIPQTRPGYLLQLTLPPGNFQGFQMFKVTRSDAPGAGKVYCIAVVNGVVYAVPQPFDQPNNWNAQRINGIQFDPAAKRIYWEAAQKGVSSGSGGTTLSTVGTYSILMMQDGVTGAAYWDGINSGQLNEDAAQTPRGTWMKYSGNRLWVSRDNVILASDLLDPLSFTERLAGPSRGDFRFSDTITGLANSIGDSRRSNLLVFTVNDTSALLSSVLDRDSWVDTQNFQSLVYPYDGCIAGKSIVPHSGLLWWYSSRGLVYADAATTSFLTSQIKIRDVEMAYSKRNFAPDLSGISGISYEGYLLMSVPSGDTLNAQTMVLDTAVSDELGSDSAPAWNGVWTGTRPIEWSSEVIDGTKRVFHASNDYFTLGGSANHIWEAFQANRMDSYDQLNADNALVRVDNHIYCEFESKLLGDGMDRKEIKYAELHMREVGGDDIKLKVSYGGSKGSYHELMTKSINANLVPPQGNAEAQALYTQLDNYFSVQSRYLITQTAKTALDNCPNIEAPYTDNIDKAFSLRVQWCGRAGIEAMRILMAQTNENAYGKCETNEDTVNILSIDGKSYKIEETSG